MSRNFYGEFDGRRRKSLLVEIIGEQSNANVVRMPVQKGKRPPER